MISTIIIFGAWYYFYLRHYGWGWRAFQALLMAIMIRLATLGIGIWF